MNATRKSMKLEGSGAEIGDTGPPVTPVILREKSKGAAPGSTTSNRWVPVSKVVKVINDANPSLPFPIDIATILLLGAKSSSSVNVPPGTELTDMFRLSPAFAGSRNPAGEPGLAVPVNVSALRGAVITKKSSANKVMQNGSRHRFITHLG